MRFFFYPGQIPNKQLKTEIKDAKEAFWDAISQHNILMELSENDVDKLEDRYKKGDNFLYGHRIDGIPQHALRRTKSGMWAAFRVVALDFVVLILSLCLPVIGIKNRILDGAVTLHFSAHGRLKSSQSDTILNHGPWAFSVEDTSSASLILHEVLLSWNLICSLHEEP